MHFKSCAHFILYSAHISSLTGEFTGAEPDVLGLKDVVHEF